MAAGSEGGTCMHAGTPRGHTQVQRDEAQFAVAASGSVVNLC
jgi:hypothetical protein